jgi:hypothetical protein
VLFDLEFELLDLLLELYNCLFIIFNLVLISGINFGDILDLLLVSNFGLLMLLNHRSLITNCDV